MGTLNPITSHKAANNEQPSSSFAKLVNKIFAVIGRILAILVAILLFLPVVLLPLSTVVPAWIWIPLA